MIHRLRYILFLIVLLSLTACSTLEPVSSDITAQNLTPCHIVYDAGSSGTRLFVYKQQGSTWQEHQGPKVSALADPVRESRGKKNSDIDAVTTEVVSALDAIKQAGPVDKKGKNKWRAFDWSTQCRAVSAMVYATAGMRLAEQQKPGKSKELWTKLKQKLQAKVGSAVIVNTRTLTGFEEGLYAWLAVREQKKAHDFGIAEMGGASTQVTFPCNTCDKADDANKTVMVDGKQLQIYSYSFLGLGQDEAPKTIGMPADCAYGIGTSQHNWKVDDCSSPLQIFDSQGIRDPYNFNAGQRGTHRLVPTDKADVKRWVLTGAFNHLDDSQIGACCVTKGQCYDKETSCFRPVYLEKYLQTLNISKSSERMDASWTLGAVICSVSDCLQKAKPAPVCRWSANGCL